MASARKSQCKAEPDVKDIHHKEDHVYIDGACSDNGRLNSKAGIGVFWAVNDDDNVGEPIPGKQTNMRADIRAAIRAIEIAKKRGITELTIHTQCLILINSITKWYVKWEKNDWKKADGEPVENPEDLKELLLVMNDINVVWKHDKKTQLSKGNEKARELSHEGIAMPLPSDVKPLDVKPLDVEPLDDALEVKLLSKLTIKKD